MIVLARDIFLATEKNPWFPQSISRMGIQSFLFPFNPILHDPNVFVYVPHYDFIETRVIFDIFAAISWILPDFSHLPLPTRQNA